jgi:hypothetical protein
MNWAMAQAARLLRLKMGLRVLQRAGREINVLQ